MNIYTKFGLPTFNVVQSPTRRLPRWRIGECLPEMVGTGNILGRTKTSTAVLQLVEGSTKARRDNLEKKIMVKGRSFTITTLRLKMNDIGKAQGWTEAVCLYCEVVELTTLHRYLLSRNSENVCSMGSPGVKYSHGVK